MSFWISVSSYRPWVAPGFSRTEHSVPASPLRTPSLPLGMGRRVVPAALFCPRDRRGCSVAEEVAGTTPQSPHTHGPGRGQVTGEQALPGGPDSNPRGARRLPGPRCIPGGRPAAQDGVERLSYPAASRRAKEKRKKPRPSARSSPAAPASRLERRTHLLSQRGVLATPPRCPRL